MAMNGVRGIVVSAIAASLVLVWCSAPLRAAAPEGDTIFLHLATVDASVNPTGQHFGQAAFVKALGEVSGGQIEVAVTTLYDSGAAEAESELVRAIASGAVDGGWPSSRAFAAAGIPGIEALEAPMTITSVAAQKALVSGPIAGQLLSELRGSGIVGLGLMVGPLRRPFAAAPLLSVDAWRGVRFRVLDSRLQADAIRSFGAIPLKSGLEWIDQTRASRLDGGDFDIPEYWARGERSTLDYVTANVVLWPMMSVLSLSQKRFDSLSDAQRGWIRDAARQAVLASSGANYDEAEYVKVLCQQGVRFLEATAGQITQLQHRLAPVTARLAASGAAGPLLKEIQALVAQQPGPDVPDIPAECRKLPKRTSEPRPVSPVPATLADGVYHADITAADVKGAGVRADLGWTGSWTLTVNDGRYAVRCRPIEDPDLDCGAVSRDRTSPDAVLDAGFVRAAGSMIYLVYDTKTYSALRGCTAACPFEPAYKLVWSVNGNDLHFTLPGGGGLAERITKTWHKVP